MPLQRTTYGFTVRLPASTARAFRWATDFQPGDLSLMGSDGTRTVERLAKDLLLLTDSYASDAFGTGARGRVVKEKLVHLLPRQNSWTSTHLSGPARYSQFLYELRPEGRAVCRLRFTGMQVERAVGPVTGRSTARRARELASEDSAAWRKLAAALGKARP
jgi:hypothetical protein